MFKQGDYQEPWSIGNEFNMELLCTGDIALANENKLSFNWKLPGGVTLSDEVRVLFNWELPIGESANPIPRSSGPRIIAHPNAASVIQKWAPGFAALANNHILDAGDKGLEKTMSALHQNGFLTVGAGMCSAEITRPALWSTSEGRLAIINWVFPETHPEWLATPGPNCWPGFQEAHRIIQELKGQADWVLVIVHWSDEDFSYPRPQDREIARELARLGADVIVGHHPHVVRGMEIFGSCPVFYSLGNYYFPDIPDQHGGWIAKQAPRNRESLGVRLSFRKGRKPEFQLLSFWQTGDQVILDPGQRAIRRMRSANRPLQMVSNSDYAEWHVTQRARFDRWGYRWHFRLWQYGVRGVIRFALRKLAPRTRTMPGR